MFPQWSPHVLLAQNEASPFGLLVPLVLVGICYYLIVFRPERKLRQNHAEMLQSLKKNDRVITTGGIHGLVVTANPGASDVVLRIDEGTNTKIRVQRSSIAKVNAGEASTEASASGNETR